jgi:hypothetical protein
VEDRGEVGNAGRRERRGGVGAAAREGERHWWLAGGCDAGGFCPLVLPGFGIGGTEEAATLLSCSTENFRLILVADKRAWVAG